MRLLKFLAVVFLFHAVIAVAPAYSLNCNEINNLGHRSLRDSIKINRYLGGPGDTVLMPLYMKTDSAVASFQMIIRYDTNMIKPVVSGSYTDTAINVTYGPGGVIVNIDTVIFEHDYYSYNLVGRLKAVQDSQNVLNTSTPSQIFVAEKSFNPLDSGALLASFNLGIVPNIVTMQQGGGVIFTIPMIVNPLSQHHDSSIVYFWETEQFYDTDSGSVNAGCRLSQIGSSWAHDTGTGVFYTNPTLYPSVKKIPATYFVVDTAPPPQINSFTSSKSTVASGGFTILAWNVTNADSIVISVNATSILKSTSLVDDTVVTPTQATTYLLTAYNATGSSSASVTVGFSSGSTGGGTGTIVGSGNDGPVVTRDSSDRVIRMKQLETLIIRVTGSDQNGDTVTLKALTTLPANAVFLGDSTNGTGLVERTFAFTPDAGQVGAFDMIFSCWDYHGASSSNYLTVIVDPFDDILYTTSDTASGRRPVGGLAGRSQVLLPINYAAAHTSYGVQVDLVFDSVQLELDSVFRTARMPGFTIYDDIGQTPGRVRVISLNLNSDSVLNDTMPILYAAFSVDSFAPPGLYDVCLENARQSVDPDPNVFGVDINSACGVLQVDMLGDANLDRHVDVADAVSTISVILSQHSFNNRQFAAADVVDDITIDVFDLVAILNLALTTPIMPLPTAGQEIPGVNAELQLDYQTLEAGESDYIYLDLDLPLDVAAAEFDLQYDPKVIALQSPELGTGISGMNIDFKNIGDGYMKILVNPRNINPAANPIRKGDNEILKIPVTAIKHFDSGDVSQFRVTRARLATPSAEALKVGGTIPPLPSGFTLAQNYPNPFNPTTNIDFSIDVDAGVGQKHVRLDIFNILGQRVKTLVDEPLGTGAYTREWDATNEAGNKVATGLYLYRLEVGDASKTKKMILLK